VKPLAGADVVTAGRSHFHSEDGDHSSGLPGHNVQPDRLFRLTPRIISTAFSRSWACAARCACGSLIALTRWRAWARLVAFGEFDVAGAVGCASRAAAIGVATAPRFNPVPHVAAPSRRGDECFLSRLLW